MADEFARVYILSVGQSMTIIVVALCAGLILGFALAFRLVLDWFDNR